MVPASQGLMPGGLGPGPAQKPYEPRKGTLLLSTLFPALFLSCAMKLKLSKYR